MPETKPSLHKKLAQVMYEAERIPKNGRAPAAMGGFPFVQVGDAADAIRKALAEKSVSMIPTAIEVVGETEHPTSSGKLMTTLTVRTTWTLTDGDSGETTVIQSLGSGADMGDKAAPKAQSNAMKYALLMGFLLSTGDDPEQTDTSDRQSRPIASGFVGTTANPAPQRHPDFTRTPEGGLIGTAVSKGTQDFNLRQTPDGFVLPFRVKNGNSSFIVVAENRLAEAIDAIKARVMDERVTVWGRWSDETTPAKGTKPEIHYRILHLERIATPDGILPAPAFDSPEPDLEQPPDDVELVGEAPTEPLGLVS
jgi:hypothetical protein